MEAYGCCPVFSLFTRARALLLERALCCCFFARARVCTLERAFRVFRFCSDAALARASYSSLERANCMFWASSLERAFLHSSMLLGCRPVASCCSLEQDFERSSEVSLCLVARATTPSLERGTYISVHSSSFFFTF